MANGPPAPQQRGKGMGGRGNLKVRNSFSKDGASAWPHQQHPDGSQVQHSQAMANGGHHRNASGQIAAVHANGYAPAKPQPSLGEMASPDLERRKQALAAECAKLQAVRRLANSLMKRCMMQFRRPRDCRTLAGWFE